MTSAPADRSPLVRAGWVAGGLTCVALGAVGVIVPGMPTTVFFIAAAACFSRSSPRLEAWVLGLKGVGPMVRDHRDGLGMPRAAKAWASASIVVFAGLAILVALDHPLVRGVVAALAAVGLAWIWFRVPTRELVLADRGAP